MKKLFCLLLSTWCIMGANAQDRYVYKPKPDYLRHELGISAGVANYVISELFGNETELTAPQAQMLYNFRVLKHMQLGATYEHSIGGVGTASSFAFRMSFPIGNESFYFYPGWHIRYVSTNGGNALGPGLHMGFSVPVSPSVAISMETAGSVLLFGTALSGHLGVRYSF